jgi:tRNA(His) 5'-end guanylyltransferase
MEVKATLLVKQRSAMAAQLVGQFAAGFAAQRARESLRGSGSPSKKDTLFGDGTLSGYVPRRSIRRMRIARNHAKFDARDTVLGTRIAEFPL